MHHILEDMVEGRDPVHRDTAIDKATLDLSPQQRTVLTLTAMGMAGPDVAGALGVSYETVRMHLKETRARLGARNTAHAVAIALQAGIIELGDRPPGRQLAA
jgi:DNA-binding CsgD family transcriptional regulator